MHCARHGCASQHSLKLATCFKSMQFKAVPELQAICSLCDQLELNSQTLAAFGPACIDHSTAAAGFHANQKTVSAGAFDLGRLVSAFHFGNPKGLNNNSPSEKLLSG
jgi:hypothetical protein